MQHIATPDNTSQGKTQQDNTIQNKSRQHHNIQGKTRQPRQETTIPKTK